MVVFVREFGLEVMLVEVVVCLEKEQWRGVYIRVERVRRLGC